MARKLSSYLANFPKLLKNKIREICKIEKHSIHISDNRNFSNIAKIIFNKNSLYFLNRIKYSNLKKEFDFIKKIKFFFKEKKNRY